MTLGLFEKIVLADTLLSGSADRVFGYPGPLVALDSWAGVLAFAGQIFFDFAGYSICAIGAALTLGFHLKDNFRFPVRRDWFLGLLAALAHLALHIFAGLPLYSVRRKSGPPVSRCLESCHCHVSWRALARRGLDVCRLGTVARLLPGDRTHLPGVV